MVKDAVYAALELLIREQLNHYDANCPHCGKVNHISRIELQRAAPDWQKRQNAPDAE